MITTTLRAKLLTKPLRLRPLGLLYKNIHIPAKNLPFTRKPSYKQQFEELKQMLFYGLLMLSLAGCCYYAAPNLMHRLMENFLVETDKTVPEEARKCIRLAHFYHKLINFYNVADVETSLRDYFVCLRNGNIKLSHKSSYFYQDWLASIYIGRKDYIKAIELYNMAVTDMEQEIKANIRTDMGQVKLRLCNILLKLSKYHANINSLENSKSHSIKGYNLLKDISIESNKQKKVINTELLKYETLIADNLAREKKYHEARIVYLNIINKTKGSENEELNDNSAQCIIERVMIRLSEIYYMEGDPATSINWAWDAYKEAAQKKCHRCKGLALKTLGMLYKNNKDYLASFNCFDACSQITKDTDQKFTFNECIKNKEYAMLLLNKK